MGFENHSFKTSDYKKTSNGEQIHTRYSVVDGGERGVNTGIQKVIIGRGVRAIRSHIFLF